MESKIIIVGISGASGAAYAQRLLEHLARAECEIHLVCSALGRRLLAEEVGIKKLDPDQLTGGRGGLLTVHNENDLGGPLASGSFRHDGMIVVPCSGNSLSKIAYGMTDNQLQRAAMVTLKERRRLVLAHRETPLSLVEIDAMRAATMAGAIVLPLSPGFYLNPKSIDDLLDFMSARMMDLLGVSHDLAVRWDEKLAGDRASRRS
ncbi:MAG: UbiX family flavin prenyltransferase [Planctomycetes bacterium]|nr:UbiX family flavin prenyltransferase [Planctomycetota bacterium]